MPCPFVTSKRFFIEARCCSVQLRSSTIYKKKEFFAHNKIMAQPSQNHPHFFSNLFARNIFLPFINKLMFSLVLPPPNVCTILNLLITNSSLFFWESFEFVLLQGQFLIFKLYCLGAINLPPIDIKPIKHFFSCLNVVFVVRSLS